MGTWGRGRWAGSGVPVRTVGEEEGAESWQEEATQPLLLSHPLPPQVGSPAHPHQGLPLAVAF